MIKVKLTVKPYPKKEKPQQSNNIQKIIQCPSCSIFEGENCISDMFKPLQLF